MNEHALVEYVEVSFLFLFDFFQLFDFLFSFPIIQYRMEEIKN